MKKSKRVLYKNRWPGYHFRKHSPRGRVRRMLYDHLPLWQQLEENRFGIWRRRKTKGRTSPKGAAHDPVEP